MNSNELLVQWLTGKKTPELYEKIVTLSYNALKNYTNSLALKRDVISIVLSQWNPDSNNCDNITAHLFQSIRYEANRMLFTKGDQQLKEHFTASLKKSQENKKPLTIYENDCSYIKHWWQLSQWDSSKTTKCYEVPLPEILPLSSIVDMTKSTEHNIKTNDTLAYCSHILEVASGALKGTTIYSIFRDHHPSFTKSTLSLDVQSDESSASLGNTITYENDNSVISALVHEEIAHLYHQEIRHLEAHIKLLIYLHAQGVTLDTSEKAMKSIQEILPHFKVLKKASINNYNKDMVIPLLRNLLTDIIEFESISFDNSIAQELLEIITGHIEEDFFTTYSIEISLKNNNSLEKSSFSASLVDINKKGARHE